MLSEKSRREIYFKASISIINNLFQHNLISRKDYCVFMCHFLFKYQLSIDDDNTPFNEQSDVESADHKQE